MDKKKEDFFKKDWVKAIRMGLNGVLVWVGFLCIDHKLIMFGEDVAAEGGAAEAVGWTLILFALIRTVIELRRWHSISNN